jgi:hypothetical protein
LCTRAVGGLGHIIERAGVATTQISLIRPHTESVKPPRALWVPFELGRPLGAPGDAGFQSDVLRNALSLLERDDTPVLEDFDHDAPASEGETWACPVQIPSPAPETEAEALRDSVLSEIRMLHPWYDEGRKARGRTAFGVAGKGVEAVEAIAATLAEAAAGTEVEPEGFSQPMPVLLKYLADDMKTFYYEAAAARPGATPSSAELNDWFFRETQFGSDLLYQLVEQQGSLARAIIPGAYARA